MEIEGLKSIPFYFICFSIFYHCYQWLLPPNIGMSTKA